MSVLTIATPAVLHSTGNLSRWSAAHNEVFWGFRRQDYSVLGGSAGAGGLCQLQMLESQTSDLQNRDILYLSSTGETVFVSNIVTATPFRFVTINQAANATNVLPGWANNHTQRRNYFIEARIHVYNNTTDLNEVAGEVRLSPNKRGEVKLIASNILEKYLSRRNRSDYTLDSYNDKDAWVKYYFSYRQVWRNYEAESFYEDRVNPYLGANLMPNSTLSNTASYELTNFTNVITSTGQGYVTNQPFVGLGYARMTLDITTWAAFPTTAGTKYRLKFKVLTSKTTGITSTNTLHVYFGVGVIPTLPWNLTQEAGLTAPYEFDFVAPFNNSAPWFECDSNYWVAIDDITLQEVFDDTATNPPNYYFANKAARQIQEVYSVNQAEHVAFYDTIADAAKRAKFISDFAQPTWFSGYPFDIAILFDKGLEPVEVTAKELFSSGTTSTVLNDTTAAEHRLTLQGGYTSADRFLDLWLEVGAAGAGALYVDDDYVDDDYVEEITPPSSETGEITERRRIRINLACVDNPEYLSWKGVHGGWNYYRFKKTQAFGSNISNQQIANPYVPDLDVEENKFQASNESDPTITMGVNGVDRNDILGLQLMLESGQVQRYMGLDSNNVPIWQTVIIKAGSFKVYETGDAAHDLEFTIELPSRYTHRA